MKGSYIRSFEPIMNLLIHKYYRALQLCFVILQCRILVARSLAKGATVLYSTWRVFWESVISYEWYLSNKAFLAKVIWNAYRSTWYNFFSISRSVGTNTHFLKKGIGFGITTHIVSFHFTEWKYISRLYCFPVYKRYKYPFKERLICKHIFWWLLY